LSNLAPSFDNLMSVDIDLALEPGQAFLGQ
jgi:hypothetical protein